MDEKTSADSSDSGDSNFSSDIYSLTLNETGPEMVVIGTLRKVRRFSAGQPNLPKRFVASVVSTERWVLWIPA